MLKKPKCFCAFRVSKFTPVAFRKRHSCERGDNHQFVVVIVTPLAFSVRRKCERGHDHKFIVVIVAPLPFWPPQSALCAPTHTHFRGPKGLARPSLCVLGMLFRVCAAQPVRTGYVFFLGFGCPACAYGVCFFLMACAAEG